MAYLTKIEDKRYQLVRYRVRYCVYFTDGSWIARSRRYVTLAAGRAKLELASALEGRTRQLQQTPEDIKVWKNEGLLTAPEAARLDLVPAPQRKTLEQAMEEYRATWEVSPGRPKTGRAESRPSRRSSGPRPRSWISTTAMASI